MVLNFLNTFISSFKFYYSGYWQCFTKPTPTTIQDKHDLIAFGQSLSHQFNETIVSKTFDILGDILMSTNSYSLGIVFVVNLIFRRFPWRDSPTVKRVYCSSRVPEFCPSTQVRWVTVTCNSSFWESDHLWPPWIHACM